MIQINLRTATVRKTVTCELTDTPADIFDKEGISAENLHVNIDGVKVSNLRATFETLGYTDGDSKTLYAVVKADGAM